MPFSFALACPKGYEPDGAILKKTVNAGAKIKMAVADMFWGDRYGKITDPFGHEWSIATHKEDLSPEEVGQRAQEFFSKMK